MATLGGVWCRMTQRKKKRRHRDCFSHPRWRAVCPTGRLLAHDHPFFFRKPRPLIFETEKGNRFHAINRREKKAPPDKKQRTSTVCWRERNHASVAATTRREQNETQTMKNPRQKRVKSKTCGLGRVLLVFAPFWHFSSHRRVGPETKTAEKCPNANGTRSERHGRHRVFSFVRYFVVGRNFFRPQRGGSVAVNGVFSNRALSSRSIHFVLWKRALFFIRQQVWTG